MGWISSRTGWLLELLTELTTREIHLKITLTNPTIWAKLNKSSEGLSDKARQRSDLSPIKKWRKTKQQKI